MDTQDGQDRWGTGLPSLRLASRNPVAHRFTAYWVRISIILSYGAIGLCAVL